MLLIAKSERNKVLVEWNDSQSHAPVDQTLQQLFEQQAHRNPDTVAVIDEHRRLTYGELNARANQLARHLLDLGAERGTLVGIDADRSIELVIGLLGIIKAGAAYLPLDRAYPAKRLEAIIADAEAPVVVQHGPASGSLPDAVRSFHLHLDGAALDRHPDSNLAMATSADDLAYCVYTSGSTGRPKGVLVRHGAVISRVVKADYIDLGPSTVMGWASSTSFDAATFEIWGALLNGGTLHKITTPDLLSPARLRKELQQHRVDVLFTTTALFKRIARHLPDCFASLQCLLFGGEAVSREAVDAIMAGGPPKRLLHVYGPTENTTFSTSFEVTYASLSSTESVPIGKPLAGTLVYVLDESLEPVPPGTPGELFVGGPGLSAGYHKQSELTASRFILSPFGPPGTSLYRTGDIVHWLPTGNLQFVGRIDTQVKIRGFRIELGEIENALRQCSGVHDSVVVASEDASGEKRLIAYLVGAQSDSLLSAVQAQLRETLPDYMLPTAWVILDDLPLNVNGKVDRSALPEPDASRVDAGIAWAAPRTREEALVTRIWADVLGVDKVGVLDGFRSLGGSSIQAIDVAYRVKHAMGGSKDMPLPLGNVTVANYVAAVLADLHQQTPDDIVDEPVTDMTHDLPAARAQEQVCFMEALGDAWRAYRFHARIWMDGPLDVRRLQRAINDLVVRHEILRTSFEQVEGRVRRRVEDDVRVGLPCIDLSHLEPEDVESAFDACMTEELAYRFDLTRAPLVRWRLIKFAPERHVLVQSEHHNAHDGASFRILLRDLAEFYSSSCYGRAANLPVLECQFGSYCQEEARWLVSSDFRKQLDEWQSKIQPFSDCTHLFNGKQPRERRFRGAQFRLSLDRPFLDLLNRTASTLGVSLYATMMAAFGLVCSRMSGQRRFLLGSALANRTSERFRWTTGMFVNMVPIPVDAEGALTFADFARGIAQHVDFALGRSGIPINELVKRIKFDGVPNGEAPFNVAFSFHDSLEARPDFSNLKVKVEEGLSNGSAKFDLNVICILDNHTASSPAEILFEYDTDLFDDATVERLARGYRTLLDAAARSPHEPHSGLALLSDDERRRILFDWNDTKAPYPDSLCIHELFEARAQQQPHAVAVTFEDRHLTYAELNRKANQVARQLRDIGVDTEMRVAICAERSPEMVVGVLAVLKAGGTYVPFDTDWPCERMGRLLARLSITKLLTTRGLLDKMQAVAWDGTGLTHVVNLSDDETFVAEDQIRREDVEDFWNFIATRSDEASRGGFVRSDNNAPFSWKEVNEYVSHIIQMLGDKDVSGRRVLEIGCGSGAIAFELIKSGASYVGLDPSAEYLRANAERARSLGHGTAVFLQGYAHEAKACVGTFDIILVASVAQFFPSYRYAEAVLEQCLEKLAPNGMLVIADVLDPGFARTSSSDLRSAHTRIGHAAPFHIATRFFESFFASRNMPVAITRRDASRFTTELSQRYDVVVRAEVRAGHRVEAIPPIVRTLSARDWTAQPGENPGHQVSADQAAYVIFTSGSTGEPKGVVVRHRPVLNLISWVNDFVEVTPIDRLFFVTSLCFDLSVYDIFGTLAAGATLDVVPGRVIRDPEELAKYLMSRPVTFWDSAPAAFGFMAAFAEQRSGVASRTLRTVFLSGDWIPLSMPDRIRELFPNARIVALGGSTEATVWSNYFVVDSVDKGWNSIPYGKPIQNCRYYVLDAFREPVPIGVQGDLYIGGDCLASGYFGDAELTASKFVPDPSNEGRPMYRTGDLARFMSDGNIEFLGRADSQVKIRGFRIELGEIEHALRAIDAVKDAVVVLRDSALGDKTLVGYVVCGSDVNVERLREELARTLPAYMVPDVVIPLASFPLSSSGKVDRRALPPPGHRLSVPTAQEQPAPEVRTSGSELHSVMRILGELLPGVTFQPTDDLLAQGMHSLLLMRFLARCKEELGANLRIRDVYKLGSATRIAEAIQKQPSTVSM
jgi:amino acid adenylation domain-containing protein